MVAIIKDFIHNKEIAILNVENAHDILARMKNDEDILDEVMRLFIDVDFQPLEVYYEDEITYCIKSEPGVGCIDTETDWEYEYSDTLELKDVISEVFDNDIAEYSRTLLEISDTNLKE